MVRLKANNLVHRDREYILTLDNVDELELDCDDITITTTGPRIIISWLMWKIHRQHDRVKVLSTHVIPGGVFTYKKFMEVLNACFWDTFALYEDDIQVDWSINERLNKATYDAVNDVFNFVSSDLGAYVSTLSALDYIGVMYHPPVQESLSKIEETHSSIKECYKEITSIIKDDPALSTNNLTKIGRCESVGMNPILQQVASRGYVSEADSTLFPHPIMPGFLQGMSGVEDSGKESRASTMAQLYANDPLKDTEYYNRRIQMVCAVISRAVRGDCGSTEGYIHTIGADDLEWFDGKYYIKDDGSLGTIRASDSSFIGKTLKIRSVYGCLHDQHTVCRTCMGDIHHCLPEGDSPGHMAAVSVGERAAQTILSLKHLIFNAIVEKFRVREKLLGIIRLKSDEITIVLKDNPDIKSVKVRLPITSIPEIRTITEVSNVHTLSLPKTSNIGSLHFVVEFKDGTVLEETETFVRGGSRSVFTYEMLEFIRENRWELVDNKTYEIDLTNFPKEIPSIMLPIAHTNAIEFLQHLKTVIESSGTNKDFRKLITYKDSYVAAIDVCRVLNTKFKANITWVEIMLKAFTTTDVKSGNYDLAVAGAPPNFKKYTDVVKNRSMGAMLAYQDHDKVLSSPAHFLVDNRTDIPDYDLLFGDD